MTDTPAERRACPHCTEQISAAAYVCPFCARDLNGPTKGEVRCADRSARRGIAIIMFVMVAQVILTIALVAAK